MTIYQARIDNLPGASAPDQYDSSNSRIPHANFVVTRKADGEPLSYYGDLAWDRSPYSADGKPFILYFQFWEDDRGQTPCRQGLVDEIRWIMFVQLWLRPGNSLSNSTLQTYINCLRAIARFCEEEELEVRDVLMNPERLGDVLHAGGRAKVLRAILQTMRQLGPDAVGLEVANRKSLSFLAEIASRYRDDAKQTPPIPTRIYSLILAVLAREVEAREHVIERILMIVEACTQDPLLGVSRSFQSATRSLQGIDFDGWRPEFPDLLRQHGLMEFWADGGYLLEKAGLMTALMEAQLVASLQIQAFTGMRQNEVAALPYFCLEEVDRGGSIHYIVKGRVTKLTQGKIKRTQWVTSSSGRDAILLAQRISKAVYGGRGDDLVEETGRINERHLFVNPAYLLEQKDRFNRPSDPKLTCRRRFKKLKSRLAPLVEQDDLKELMRIDPHRAWATEADFRPGRGWKLKSHQFRRSLALYAQRSGLVSLPTLKRQLQHITQEMSLYYARGSAFARDFIGAENEQPHFGEEWQETQPVSQYLSYVKHVLFSDDADLLYGGHMQFVNMRLRDKEGSLLHDREATLTRFKKGEIAWKPTPVGGCVNTAPCDKSPIDLLEVNCVANNCKNMVGNLKKTERVIQIKTAQVEAMRKIDAGSPEFRQEQEELRMLTQGYERAKGWLAKSKEAA